MGLELGHREQLVSNWSPSLIGNQLVAPWWRVCGGRVPLPNLPDWKLEFDSAPPRLQGIQQKHHVLRTCPCAAGVTKTRYFSHGKLRRSDVRGEDLQVCSWRFCKVCLPPGNFLSVRSGASRYVLTRYIIYLSGPWWAMVSIYQVTCSTGFYPLIT